MPSFGSTQSVSGPGGVGHGPAVGARMRVDFVTVCDPVGDGTAAGTGPSRAGPSFNSQAQMFRGQYFISGVTRDSALSPLASCRVALYQTRDDVVVNWTTSDEVGAFRFQVSTNYWTYYMGGYLVGSPDRFGTTVNTLTGS